VDALAVKEKAAAEAAARLQATCEDLRLSANQATQALQVLKAEHAAAVGQREASGAREAELFAQNDTMRGQLAALAAELAAHRAQVSPRPLRFSVPSKSPSSSLLDVAQAEEAMKSAAAGQGQATKALAETEALSAQLKSALEALAKEFKEYKETADGQLDGLAKDLAAAGATSDKAGAEQAAANAALKRELEAALKEYSAFKEASEQVRPETRHTFLLRVCGLRADPCPILCAIRAGREGLPRPQPAGQGGARRHAGASVTPWLQRPAAACESVRGVSLFSDRLLPPSLPPPPPRLLLTHRRPRSSSSRRPARARATSPSRRTRCARSWRR
jgi:hypothetical protein